MKIKFRKLFYGLLLVYAQTFPSSGLIHQIKTAQELEEDDEIHLGI